MSIVVPLEGFGGGGTGLNFKVVGGTSQPTNPRENTIWVNTNTSITSYVFSVTQPTGSSGMVWFQIGTSSSVPFNALKKNTLRVYPMSCKQYVSGSWVAKTAKTYLSSTWTDWAVNLYFVKSGVKNSEQTYISATQNSTLTSSGGLLTINPSGDSYRGLYFKGKKENHATLNIDGVFTGNETSIKVWNVSSAPTYQNYADTAIASATVNTSSGTLDISKLANGEYYFGFCSKNNETNKIRNFYIK